MTRLQMQPSLDEVGREFGVSREAIRIVQANALRKLRCPGHRARVAKQLRVAFGDLRALQRSGASIEIQFGKAQEVNDLVDALEWLDSYRDGGLMSQLAAALNRDEFVFPSVDGDEEDV